MAANSLVVSAEIVVVGGVLARCRVPHILGVPVRIRVLLDLEISITRHEEPEQR